LRKINKSQAINIAERILLCKAEQKRCSRECKFCKRNYTQLEVRRLATFVIEEGK